MQALYTLNKRKIDVFLYCSNTSTNFSGNFKRSLCVKYLDLKLSVLITALGLLFLVLIFFSKNYIQTETDYFLMSVPLIFFLTIITILVTSIRYKPKFPLFVYDYKKMRYLVHSKIYIVDDIAFIGSLNFTNAGLYRNFESIIKIEDPEAVHEIENSMNEIIDEMKLTTINKII